MKRGLFAENGTIVSVSGTVVWNSLPAAFSSLTVATFARHLTAY